MPGFALSTTWAKGIFKALSEVLRHESIHNGVYAAVEIRHEGKGHTDVLEVTIVQAIHMTEGDEHIVN